MIPLRTIPHPRSIIRSRLLWLALPGLIFLLWGWFNDPAFFSSIRISAGDYRVSISDDGRTFWPVASRYDPGHWSTPRFSYGRLLRAKANILPAARMTR